MKEVVERLKKTRAWRNTCDDAAADAAAGRRLRHGPRRPGRQRRRPDHRLAARGPRAHRARTGTPRTSGHSSNANRSAGWSSVCRCTRPAARGRRRRRRGRSASGWRASPGLPVVYADERFTTAFAESALWAAGLTHKKRKARRDAVAAQMMLQAFLDAGCPAEVS